MIFDIKGKPAHCSREFVRAWLHATVAVLAFHNQRALTGGRPVTVHFMSEAQIGEDENGRTLGGYWQRRSRTVAINRTSSREGTATIILHEMIHAMCGGFGPDTNEHCTSTLTAKLKPSVAALANVLQQDTYKRAAYFAHASLSYRVDEDSYNDDQWKPAGARDKYGKRRRRLLREMRRPA